MRETKGITKKITFHNFEHNYQSHPKVCFSVVYYIYVKKHALLPVKKYKKLRNWHVPLKHLVSFVFICL